MTNTRMIYLSIIIVFIGIIIYLEYLSTILVLSLITIICIFMGVAIVLWIHIRLSSPHMTNTMGAEHLLKDLEHFHMKLMKDYDNSHTNKTNYPIIFGRTVDCLLQQLLDLIIRDYILIYLKDYAYNSEFMIDNIKEDMWSAIQILHERFTRIDLAKLIACDIVTKITRHFEKIRESKCLVIETDHPPVFPLSPQVMSSEQELKYLQSVSEILIMFLLPRSYSLSPSKYFLREILTYKVFQPGIDLITDPDFLNLHLIYYIKSQKQKNHKTLENLKSFDDIQKMINRTDDIETIKSIRYNIVTKLMQATTLQNLNRSKGLDLENEKNTNTSKTDLNAAKKLQKYINQLMRMKKECDKRMMEFGDDSKKSVPLLTTILDNVLGRKYLSQFLMTLASQDLVRYWTMVEELRTTSKKNWYQLGVEIFYTFIRNPLSEIKIDKITKKRMEAFLLGDKGPEVFYEVQQQVLRTIEEKYYQSFLISDYYKQMLIAMESDDVETIHDRTNDLDHMQSVIDNNVDEHSNYAKKKLNQLQERLENKTEALKVLRGSLRDESRVLIRLEKEVEWLEGERRQLEAHLNRTEIWSENLGKWKTIVQSAEWSDEKEPLQFVLVVHKSDDDQMIEMEDEDREGSNEGAGGNISTGWVVCRNLTQFQELHRKLRPLSADIKNLELPTNTFKFLFGKNDRGSLERAKLQIQRYLNYILSDERLNQSEAVYSFLSPSSDHLKHSTPSPKKTKFSFYTLFKSGSENSSKDSTISILRDSEDEDIVQSLESTTDTVDYQRTNGGGASCNTRIYDDTKDTIAEPLYNLLSELFDMRGVFKYVRKTLIGFVQVTYGSNINRQIHETIAWWFSEHMLHYYLTMILQTFWPGGSLAKSTPKRNYHERYKTGIIAQETFINNVPELLSTLVGTNAAKNGARKIFEALQEKNLNKQLFYEVFEVVMDGIFPEMN